LADKGRTRAPSWRLLPIAAQCYVVTVIVAGGGGLFLFFPRTLPHPVSFAVLTCIACITSTWKVTLPIPVANGSTLSVSYAANLMALLLLGGEAAVIAAAAGVWTQCAYKARRPYPTHRTVFSTATAVLTMAATSEVYGWLGGSTMPVDVFPLAKALVGAIATYFLVNTGLIATAIALSTNGAFLKTWRDDFLWSLASFLAAGTAGALAAIVVARGHQWTAVLLMAPIYLTYRTYRVFLGRLEDQIRHTDEVRAAERALSGEKERLATALTEMTRLESREQKARKSAEEANRLKDQFLAVVSHELRTPLTAILGWADMLCKGTLAEPAMRDRAIASIARSANRQARLIDDLLDVARIASGKLRLECTSVDLGEVVREALQAAGPIIEAKRIHIVVDTTRAGTPIVGDALRLQQVVSNLVSNALKFTPEGGAILIRVSQADDAAELIVSDTGQGIAPDFLPSVFEPFRQVDESTTRVHSGLGLGLAIVKHLVEAHNGTVAVRSAGEGQGTTFVVKLPIGGSMCEPDSGVTPQVVQSASDDEATSLEGVSVLVVDDDQESRDIVAAYLSRHRAGVLPAASAASALDMLAREQFNVLLADIAMPEEDGYGLIRRVRSSSQPHTASIPAVALTAFTREEDREQALRAGFQLHLAKPVDERLLVGAVARLRRASASVHTLTAG